MSGIFAIFVRVGENDSAAATEFRGWLERIARSRFRGQPADLEDIVQETLFTLVMPGRPAMILATLEGKHPWLGEARRAIVAGAGQHQPPKTIHGCDAVMAQYVRTALRNKFMDYYRGLAKERSRNVSLDSDVPRRPDTVVLEGGEAEVAEAFDLLERAVGWCKRSLDEVQADRLDETVRQVVSLAAGEIKMCDLTNAEVQADPELSSKPPEEARKTARNRLQKRHQRARESLLGAVAALEEREDFSVADACTCTRLIKEMLVRCQTKAKQPVPRGES